MKKKTKKTATIKLSGRFDRHAESAEVPFEPSSLIGSEHFLSWLIHSACEIVCRLPIVEVISPHKRIMRPYQVACKGPEVLYGT